MPKSDMLVSSTAYAVAFLLVIAVFQFLAEHLFGSDASWNLVTVFSVAACAHYAGMKRALAH